MLKNISGMTLMLIGTALGVVGFGITCLEGVRGTDWSVVASVITTIGLFIFMIGAIRKNRIGK